jgi:organic radical activating enzyme
LSEISENIALEKVKSIVGKYNIITFSGGEPGLLSRNILE